MFPLTTTNPHAPKDSDGLIKKNVLLYFLKAGILLNLAQRDITLFIFVQTKLIKDID